MILQEWFMAKASFSACLLGNFLLKIGENCMFFDQEKTRPILIVLFVPSLSTFCLKMGKTCCFAFQEGKEEGRKWGLRLIHVIFSAKCASCVNLLQFSCARNPPERSSCEIFRRDRRKMRRNFGEIFRRFSSFNFQGKWPQKISWKILDIFHGAPN